MNEEITEYAVAVATIATATGEPVFILRARDALTPDTIRFWIGAAMRLEVSQLKIGAAEEHLLAVEEWQKIYGCKIPD